MPNGFMNKSLAIPGLTTVSLNMGVTRIEDKELKIYYSIRSPMASAKEELSKQLDAIASIFDCQTVVKNDYPGWQYDDNSPLRKQYISYVKQAENFDIQSEASHGGLETGIFKGLIPELDIITIGPDMYDIHTPDERLSLSSFDKCYNRLVGFLEAL
ncbi:MAG: aminoacyl-histidine dipeptidase, partial [Coprobacillaceae bacterium]